jgi:hypothetical protein
MHYPEPLVDVVFERTPQGVIASKVNGADLPRNLKTLLLAIDGSSTVSKFVPFLTNLLPLSDKFVELERLGYVQRRVSNDKKPVSTAAASSLVSKKALESEAALFEHALANLAKQQYQTETFEQPPTHHSFGNDFSHVANVAASDATSDDVNVVDSAAVHATQQDRAALAKILREMEVTLSNAAGLEALPIVMTFMQITTLDQLKTELPAYFEVIQSFNIDQGKHALVIENLMDGNW